MFGFSLTGEMDCNENPPGTMSKPEKVTYSPFTVDIDIAPPPFHYRGRGRSVPMSVNDVYLNFLVSILIHTKMQDFTS